MTTPHPPKRAAWLLERLSGDNEPLIGDLHEEFARRQSAWWFWRQVLAVAINRPFRRPCGIRPLRLLDDDPICSTLGQRAAAPRSINLTASPVPGIGGLGLAVLAGLVTTVRPEAWWLLAGSVLGGIALGIVLIGLGARAHDSERNHGVLV